MIFLMFLLKHTFWVHVKTASLRRFLRVPTMYVLDQIKKNRYTSANPSFLYESGVQGGYKFHGNVCLKM